MLHCASRFCEYPGRNQVDGSLPIANESILGKKMWTTQFLICVRILLKMQMRHAMPAVACAAFSISGKRTNAFWFHHHIDCSVAKKSHRSTFNVPNCRGAAMRRCMVPESELRKCGGAYFRIPNCRHAEMDNSGFRMEEMR